MNESVWNNTGMILTRENLDIRRKPISGSTSFNSEYKRILELL
jgi:hypothetical protein